MIGANHASNNSALIGALGRLSANAFVIGQSILWFWVLPNSIKQMFFTKSVLWFVLYFRTLTVYSAYPRPYTPFC